jgi:ATP/maltotriose-dependent transcriptional regulator MalT
VTYGLRCALSLSKRAQAWLLIHRVVLAEPLSARELDVLRLLSDGRSNAEIARDLFVEQSTVKTHLIHLYRKLGVSIRTQAINRARALRLLD